MSKDDRERDARISQRIERLRAILIDLEEEDRVTVLNAVFCAACGTELRSQVCYCTNDE